MVKTYVFDDSEEEFIDIDGLKEVMGIVDFMVTDESMQRASGSLAPKDVDGRLYWPYLKVKDTVTALGILIVLDH